VFNIIKARSKDSQVKTQLVLWIFISFKVTRWRVSASITRPSSGHKKLKFEEATHCNPSNKLYKLKIQWELVVVILYDSIHNQFEIVKLQIIHLQRYMNKKTRLYQNTDNYSICNFTISNWLWILSYRITTTRSRWILSLYNLFYEWQCVASSNFSFLWPDEGLVIEAETCCHLITLNKINIYNTSCVLTYEKLYL